ncbi:hypothetical protein CBS147321_11058 [Aspergillus niger]|nr:hypothetical protein CBS133816_9036 [Aspergillus niger]KAI2928426.1 hypothetical protein CBS147321_11058 [Aspergillus niger]KAI2952706.1 hypothetical protein CBS147322_4422 [Aspergillus niger]KAI2975067.1 hypothetical protein CBS147324_3252 [Aspergillus niger]KAI2996915.1 hypothetical protein CBS147482_7899 [Aspergillus niger]
MGIRKAKTLLPEVDGLDNESRVRVLGIIDKLRELGINENVSLPQLVVVGDQSSGKSSLLEGLTGLSFPVAADLCTRFATQIVLRRTAEEDAGVRITIIPGPLAQANDELKAHLLGFERKLRLHDFGRAEFKDIFDQAASHMGVPGPSTTELEGLDKRFSDDILKIELSGPQHRHLSVVDVPGLFHNPTKYQTEEDKIIIRRLIESYITDKRTIILFTMARGADPQGARTVGIITKCDAVQSGDEHAVMKIAQNEVEKLNHGWFAVRNRSTKDINEGVDIEGRHRKEREFFASVAPWNELKKDRVGVQALKDFLGQLLYKHIMDEFPEMVKEIAALSQQNQEELDKLGPSRQTSADQRRYLTRIAAKYQLEVTNALGGNYDPGLEADSPLKLRMHIRNLNDKFADTMARNGHARVFLTTDGELDQEYVRGTNHKDIYTWIRSIYRDSRGAELPGTVHPNVLMNMFCEQSLPWKSIAEEYLAKVGDVVSAYNEGALASLVGDDDVRRQLEIQLRHKEDEAMANAKEQLRIVLNDERRGPLQTVNHYFADNLAATREERSLSRLKKMGFNEENMYNIDVKELLIRAHQTNNDQAVDDIHDILKSFYKVAMKRFNDNVVVQVVERCILGDEGAFQALTPEMIGDLTDRALEDIAGENYATSSARNDLISKIDRFQRGLEITRQAGI